MVNDAELPAGQWARPFKANTWKPGTFVEPELDVPDPKDLRNIFAGQVFVDPTSLIGPLSRPTVFLLEPDCPVCGSLLYRARRDDGLAGEPVQRCICKLCKSSFYPQRPSCPRCGSVDTKSTKSDAIDDGVRRQTRLCDDCSLRFDLVFESYEQAYW